MSSFKYNHDHSSLQLLIDASESGCWVCCQLILIIKEKINTKNTLAERSHFLAFTSWRLCRSSHAQKSYELWFNVEDGQLFSFAIASNKGMYNPSYIYILSCTDSMAHKNRSVAYIESRI